MTTRSKGRAARILVANDVEETRDAIEKLLVADGYRVDPARDERDAVDRARRGRPDLILVSLAGRPLDVVASAVQIRRRGRVSSAVPVVVFCLPVSEGIEAAIGDNVYITRPDSFDQLRAFLHRLLRESTRSV